MAADTERRKSHRDGHRSKRHKSFRHREERDGDGRHRERNGEKEHPGAWPKEDAPDIEELRRARAEYYNRSPEGRRRRSAKVSTERVDATLDRRRERERERKAKSRTSESHRDRERRRRKDKERKRDDKIEEERDSGVYVYSRRAPERREEASQTVETREEEPRVRRSKTVRSSRSTATKDSRLSRRRTVAEVPAPVIEPVEEESEDEAERQAPPAPVEPPRPAPRERAQSSLIVPRLDRSKSTRTASVRDPARPSLRRSYTTSRTKSTLATPAPAAVPPSIAGKVPASTTAARESRRSTGLFGGLFKPPPPKGPEKKVTCVVCLADDIPISKSASLACGHSQCRSCLKRQFKLSVTDPQHMPPKCCTAEHIPLKHVERLFDIAFKKQWEKKYMEYTAKNRLYCPTRGCGQWIKPSHIKMDMATGRKYGMCKKCRTKVCAICNGKWHQGKECPKDEETKKFVEVAKEKGWQKCFNCSAMVELKEGCNHMTCRCTAQFCMICASPWKTCDCPWFNYTDPNPDDRLNDMMIPQPLRVPLNDGPMPIFNFGQRQRNHQRQQQQQYEAAENERADEELARRLQDQLIMEEINRDPAPNDDDDVDDVHGIGNAADHHMNDTYQPRQGGVFDLVRQAAGLRRVRTERIQGGRPARNGEASASGAGNRTPAGARTPAREGSAVGSNAGSGASTPASAMAGLALDGSRRGAGRVGTWLLHIEHDPAEVEGREQMETELY